MNGFYLTVLLDLLLCDLTDEWRPHNWDKWDWPTAKPTRRKSSSASHGATESERTESSTEKSNQVSELSSSLMGGERTSTSGVWQEYNRSRTASLKNMEASLNATPTATKASITAADGYTQQASAPNVTGAIEDTTTAHDGTKIETTISAMSNTDNIGVSTTTSSGASFTSVLNGSTLAMTTPTTKPTEETIFATTRPDLTTAATELPHTDVAGMSTSETKPTEVSRSTPVTEEVHIKPSTESNGSHVAPDENYDGTRLYPYYQKTYSPAVIASIIGSALCTILSAIAITIIVLELYRLHDLNKNTLKSSRSFTRV